MTQGLPRGARTTKRTALSVAVVAAVGLASPAGGAWTDLLGSGKQASKTSSGTRHDPAFPSAAGRTPSIRWTQVLGNVHSSPVELGGDVYIGAGGAGLVKLDLAGGSVQWTAAVGTIHSAPCVTDGGFAYALTDQGLVRAVDVSTGSVAWSQQVDVAASHWGGVSVGEDRLHYSTMFYKVGSLDAASGSPLFSRTMDSSMFTVGTVWGGRVHHCSESTIVYSLDPQTGQTIWQHIPSDLLYGSAVIGDGRLFIGSGDTQVVYAYDAASGALLWTYSAGSPIYSTAAYANQKVYVTTAGGRVVALDGATGSVAWSHETGGQMHGSPAVGGDTVYASANQNTLWAFDAATGAVRWSFATGDTAQFAPTDRTAGRSLRNSIALADSTILFPNANGRLHAIELVTPSPTPSALIVRGPGEKRAEPRLQPMRNVAGPDGALPIRVLVPSGGDSVLAVLNGAGETVATLGRFAGPAEVEIAWNLRNDSGVPVAAGVYLLRLAPPAHRALFARVGIVR